MLKVGDKVTWSSHAGSKVLTRSGVVIGTIPAGTDAKEAFSALEGRTKYRFRYHGGAPRRAESYLVRLDAGNDVFWPVTSGLKLSEKEEAGEQSAPLV